MKIDLVKLVEEVYKLEGEPKNVNKVFALICLQAFKEQLTLTSVSQQRELLEAYQHFIDWNEEHDRKASTSERIESFIASNCG